MAEKKIFDEKHVELFEATLQRLKIKENCFTAVIDILSVKVKI
jgi:hypothetical protein